MARVSPPRGSHGAAHCTEGVMPSVRHSVIEALEMTAAEIPPAPFSRKMLRGGQNGSRFDGKHAGSSKTPRVFRENTPRRGTNKCILSAATQSRRPNICIFVAQTQKRGTNKCILSATTRKRATNICIFVPQRKSGDRTFVLSFPNAKAGSEHLYFRSPARKRRPNICILSATTRKRGANKCIFVPQRESGQRTNIFLPPGRKPNGIKNNRRLAAKRSFR